MALVTRQHDDEGNCIVWFIQYTPLNQRRTILCADSAEAHALAREYQLAYQGIKILVGYHSMDTNHDHIVTVL